MFLDEVLPILRQRGLFRSEYAGSTLRDHYGLNRPASRFTLKTALNNGALSSEFFRRNHTQDHRAGHGEHADADGLMQ